jgi:hypothetical protein
LMAVWAAVMSCSTSSTNAKTWACKSATCAPGRIGSVAFLFALHIYTWVVL